MEATNEQIDRNELLASTRAVFVQNFVDGIEGVIKQSAESLLGKADKSTYLDQRRMLEARGVLLKKSFDVKAQMKKAMEKLLHRSFQTTYSSYRPSFSNSLLDGPISLMDTSAFEDELRFNSITDRFRNEAGEQLRDLNIRIALLFEQDNIRERENPFRPYMFSRAILKAVESVDAPPELHPTLTDQLAEDFASQVPLIYAAVNSHLAENGIAAQLMLKPKRSAEQQKAQQYDDDDEDDFMDDAPMAPSRGKSSARPTRPPQAGPAAPAAPGASGTPASQVFSQSGAFSRSGAYQASSGSHAADAAGHAPQGYGQGGDQYGSAAPAQAQMPTRQNPQPRQAPQQTSPVERLFSSVKAFATRSFRGPALGGSSATQDGGLQVDTGFPAGAFESTDFPQAQPGSAWQPGAGQHSGGAPQGFGTPGQSTGQRQAGHGGAGYAPQASSAGGIGEAGGIGGNSGTSNPMAGGQGAGSMHGGGPGSMTGGQGGTYAGAATGHGPVAGGTSGIAQGHGGYAGGAGSPGAASGSSGIAGTAGTYGAGGMGGTGNPGGAIGATGFGQGGSGDGNPATGGANAGPGFAGGAGGQSYPASGSGGGQGNPGTGGIAGHSGREQGQKQGGQHNGHAGQGANGGDVGDAGSGVDGSHDYDLEGIPEDGPWSGETSNAEASPSRPSWLSGKKAVGDVLRRFFSGSSAPDDFSDDFDDGVDGTSGQAQARPAPGLLSGTVQRLIRHSTPSTSDMYTGDGEIRNLIMERRSGLTEMANNVKEQMTIDIVSMLFEFILRDTQVPAEVRAQLGRLQFLVLKIALRDESLLTTKAHPARMLVNRIGSISLGLKQIDPSGGNVTQEICRIVEAILADETENPNLFLKMLDDLDTFIARELLTKEKGVSTAVEAVEHAENRTLRLAHTCAQVSESLQGLNINEHLRDFLENHWARAIEYAERNNPAIATEYRAVIPDLLWSVLPKVNEEDRQQLLALLPPILKIIHGGMEPVGWPAANKQTLMDWLFDAHTLVLRGNSSGPAPISFSSIHTHFKKFVDNPEAVQPSEPGHVSPENRKGYLEQAMRELDVRINMLDHFFDEEGMAEDEEILEEEPQDDAAEPQLDIAERLRVGVAIEVNLGGKPSIGRLNWINPAASNLVLTLNDQAVPSMISVRMFQRMLKNDRVRFLEDEPIFERAVESLLISASEV